MNQWIRLPVEKLGNHDLQGSLLAKDLVTDQPMMWVMDIDHHALPAGCEVLEDAQEHQMIRLPNRVSRIHGQHNFIRDISEWSRTLNPEEAALGFLFSSQLLIVWFRDDNWRTLFRIKYGDWLVD